MLPFKKFLFSSIGKKYVMALSGISLVGFLVTHLGANLTLLTGNPDLINAYGHNLKSLLGPFFYPVEMGLFATFAIHFVLAFVIHFKDKPEALGKKGSALRRGYKDHRGKGGNSKFGLAANNMIYTGGLLLVFLVVHLYQIRYQWQFGSKYTTDLNGETVPDMYRYCAELFADPLVVGFYVTTMVIVFLHIRHGFWSWVQSLGAMKPEWSKGIYFIALAVAATFAIGFIIIPIWMHFDIAGKLQ